MTNDLHLLSIATVLTLICISGCTKKAPEVSSAPPAQAPVTASATAPAPKLNNKIDVELKLGSDGDNLYFTKKEMTVKAGQTVKVIYKSNASASSNMNHNWVLVKPGTEQQVSSDGMSAGEGSDWVAEGPNVIAHTHLAKPGEIVSVVFTAPAPGDYPYICTYPGHAVTMKGVLHVK